MSAINVRSLSDLAFDVIGENCGRYDRDLVVSVITPRNRRKWLNEAWSEAECHNEECNSRESHVDKLWAKLPFIFKSTKYFKIIRLNTLQFANMSCRGFSLSNLRFQEFIRCLGENTPHLAELKIAKPPRLILSLKGLEINSIAKLTCLSRLEIEVSISMSGFVKIIESCGSLVKVRAELIDVDVDQPSDSFSEKFIYQTINARLLRNRTIGWKLSTTMPPNNPQFTGTPRYSLLHLKPRYSAELKSVLRLSRVTHAIIDCKELFDDWQIVKFPQFAALQQATVYCNWTAEKTLKSFLRENGKLLKKLVLKTLSSDCLTVEELFRLCPRLESLELHDFFLPGGNQVPVDNLSQLKRFIWNETELPKNGEVPFSKFLFAPLLEEFVLVASKIRFTDIDEIVAKIEASDILKNLKCFQFCVVLRGRRSAKRLTRAIKSVNPGVQHSVYF